MERYYIIYWLNAETLNQQFFSVFNQEDVTNIPTLAPNSDIPSIASLIINLKGTEQHLYSLIEDKAPGPDQHYPRVVVENGYN